MFGLVGLVLLAAAFAPVYRPLAYIAGLVSVTSFVLLAWGVGGYNASLARVVAADLLAAACLLVAIGVDHWQRRFPSA